MTFVLDASIALAWILGEPAERSSQRARDAMHAGPAFVPTIWPLEIANVLLVQARNRRIGWDHCAGGLRELAELAVEIDVADVQHALGAVASLAQQHGITSYDATYIELALRLALPLATLDRRLARIAAAAGAALL